MNRKTLLTLTALWAVGGSTLAFSQDTETDEALDALLRQAEFWQNNQRPDLARETLERYLLSRPNSPEVLYRLALHSLQEGREEEAQKWAAQLAEVAPDDPRLAELALARKGLTVSSSALAKVRQQAQAGQYREALAGYRELFNGDTPPRNLAPEYYQTMAGTDSGWSRARKELQRLHDAYPKDRQVARALAEVLTYRDETRREGIDRLAAMADAGMDVDRAWRQALVWLTARASDKPRYQKYLAAHPNDSALMQVYEKQVGEGERLAGYRALRAGRLDSAEKAFRRVLKDSPNDADARAGLGIVMLRRERFKEARDLLASAMKASPKEREKWLEAWTSADFYAQLEEARQIAAENPEQALERLQPLVEAQGDAGRSARLLRASILRDMGRLGEAEQAYRRMLANSASDVDAQLGLIEVLRQQERWGEATRLARQLPAGAKEHLNSLRDAEATVLRVRASGEAPADAEATLREALQLAPQDPWVRLDLARLLVAGGRNAEAEALMSALIDAGATPEQRYAAAMLAAEQERWQDVGRLLNEVPESNRTQKMRELLVEASVQGELQRALHLVAEGRDAAASDVLQTLRQSRDLPTTVSGTIALALTDAGEKALALQWVNADISGGIKGNPGDYAKHVLVLARGNRMAEAEALLSRLRNSAEATDQDVLELDEVARGVAVIKADQLRQEGQLAGAYDELAAQLRLAPDDEELLLAMARLYDSGGNHRQAAEIYDYVLLRHPGSEAALEAALQHALASGEPDRAYDLLEEHAQGSLQEDPDMLLLAARVEHSRGNSSRALRLLETAQDRLTARTRANGLHGGWQTGVGANPFLAEELARPSDRPSWLPGGAEAKAPASEPNHPSALLAHRINQLMTQIRRERGTQHEFATVLTLRTGEEGLSKQDRLETPLKLSSMLWNMRLGLEIVPTSIHSGTPSGDAARRFGQSALMSGVSNLDGSLSGLGSILDGIENTAQNYFDAQERATLAAADPSLPATEKQRLQSEATRARRDFDRALERDPVYEAGLQVANLSATERAILDRQLAGALANVESQSLSGSSAQAFAASREALEDAVSDLRVQLDRLAAGPVAAAQRDAGLGLAVSLDAGSFHADLGTTPVGFEETNIVGGIAWQPALTTATTMSLKLERRPIKDSVLSYAGTQDPVSGNIWGAVVRSGAGVGVGYEAAGIGLYGDLAGYRYTGENVADNDAAELSFGGYYKPINTDYRTLQAGIHINAMSFDQNLGYFTYGHGGYFSPQSYLSIAYPLSFEERRGRWRYKAYLTPGYQTFSRDAADYFPSNPDAQALLAVYGQLTPDQEVRYAADSESGAGVSVGGNAEYRIGQQLSLGTQLSYDSFGAYNEYSIRFYLINRPFSP